jgi:hypothetical protein
MCTTPTHRENILPKIETTKVFFHTQPASRSKVIVANVAGIDKRQEEEGNKNFLFLNSDRYITGPLFELRSDQNQKPQNNNVE